jgi:glutaredoxin
MIKVYSRKACHLCQRLKQILDNKQIQYITVDLDLQPDEATKLREMGIRELPQMWDGVEYIGGFNTSLRYIEEQV